MTRCRLNHARERKHVAAALDLLAALGATDVAVVANRTIRLSWQAGGGGRLMISLAIRPRSVDACAKHAREAIRQCYRRHGLAVRA